MSVAIRLPGVINLQVPEGDVFMPRGGLSVRILGYDRSQVRSLLGQQAELVEALGRDKLALEQRLRLATGEAMALRRRVAELEAKQREVEKTLLDAQTEAAHRLAEADGRATEIVSRAKAAADGIREDAQTLQRQLGETRQEAVEMLEQVLSQLRDGMERRELERSVVNG